MRELRKQDLKATISIAASHSPLFSLFHNKEKKTSGVTHRDNFVVTGSKWSLSELKRLDSEQISKYRSHVARCLFLSQVRADITFAVNELCQSMSDLSQRSFSKLKRLKGERETVDPSFGIRGHEFRSDSFLGLRLGWRQKTRKSSSAGVALVGHLLDANTRKHCRSRTVCSSIGSVRSEGVQSMVWDLGFAVKPVFIIDAKATEHILHRHGSGKRQNETQIDVAHLWLRDEVKSNRLGDRDESAWQKNHQKTCDSHGVH